MLTETTQILMEENATAEGQSWYDLYTWLLPLVEMWVRDSHVSSWYGQQREIAEDIAHEAIMRTFRYQQRADRGEIAPIGSTRALIRVIARNYFRDWRKKDWCLVRSSHTPEEGESGPFEAQLPVHEVVDAAQIALDHLMLDSIITTVAQVVSRFPQGQKAALLADLANISDLNSAEPTRLERAFSNVGVQLSGYKRPRSTDPAERGRDAALRSIAYKRLKHEVNV